MDKTPPTELETAIKGLRFDLKRVNDVADSDLVRRPIRTIATAFVVGSLLSGAVTAAAFLILRALTHS
jgi:hypothetical protein